VLSSLAAGVTAERAVDVLLPHHAALSLSHFLAAVNIFYCTTVSDGNGEGKRERERESSENVGGVVRRKNESNRLRYTSHLHLLSDCEYRYSYLVCV